MLKDDHRSNSAPAAKTETSDQEYKVGPGRPPKEYQFKPGQSGNPKGAKRKASGIAPDLKAIFKRAASKTVTLKHGAKEQMITMWEAGIQQLFAQYAKGDRHARRDVFWLADKYGMDLMEGGSKAFEEALATNHEAILLSYVRRQYDKVVTPARVFASPELMDDDPEDHQGKGSGHHA
jgi:hypothetical protein